MEPDHNPALLDAESWFHKMSEWGVRLQNVETPDRMQLRRYNIYHWYEILVKEIKNGED